MKKIGYKVSGIVNSESKTKICNSLNKVEGVNEVDVDIARGKVEVGYNQPATEDDIRICIQKTGYKIE